MHSVIKRVLATNTQNVTREFGHKHAYYQKGFGHKHAQLRKRGLAISMHNLIKDLATNLHDNIRGLGFINMHKPQHLVLANVSHISGS